MSARELFEPNSRVLLMEFNGLVSKTEFEVVPNEDDPKSMIRSDRHSRIMVQNTDTGHKMMVNHHRVVPVEAAGKTLVIESSNRLCAVCNNCNYVEEVLTVIEQFNCQNCGSNTPVYWPEGIKMSTETDKSPKSKTKERAAKRETTPKAEKTIPIDFSAFQGKGEIYERAMNFNHAKIDTRTYIVLIEDGDNSRKLCFNTYGGAVNARKPVPIEDFINNKSNGKSRWYAVKDMEAARSELLKKEYKLISH